MVRGECHISAKPKAHMRLGGAGTLVSQMFFGVSCWGPSYELAQVAASYGKI